MTKVPTFNRISEFQIDQNFNYIQQLLQNLSPGDNFTVPTYYIKDIKDNNTTGGTPSGTGEWLKRDLNTVSPDNGDIRLSNDRFTLPAGKYAIDIFVPAEGAFNSKARLYNLTDTKTEIVSAPSDGAQPTLVLPVCGYISISASKTFEVQHFVDFVIADGFGSAALAGADDEVEVYTTVKITKVG